MKKVPLFILLTSGVGVFVLSCTKSSMEAIAGPVICDTSAVSYTNDVVPILQEYCYNCHGAHVSADGGGIILEGYGNLANYADNNQLSGDISAASGYTAMPYGNPKLPSCQLNKILAWINQGIKDN
jgi:uncharacterized membrane protein